MSVPTNLLAELMKTNELFSNTMKKKKFKYEKCMSVPTNLLTELMNRNDPSSNTIKEKKKHLKHMKNV